jgi:hypothetical protein
MDHSIVFKGEVRQGLTGEEVRSNLARLFKLEPGAQIDRLFSGRPVTLKKGLSAEQAQKYADGLLRAGAVCEIVSTRADAPHAAARPTVATATVAPVAAPGLAGLSLLPVEKPEEKEADHVPIPAPAMARPASPYAVSPGSQRMETLSDINTSGSGANARVPDEARGLSWGGFLMNWIWGPFNGSYIALLSLAPIVGFFVPFYLLFKGRELAWRNRRWDSVEHFNRVQRRWGLVGLVLAILVTWYVFGVMDDIRQVGERGLAAEAGMSDSELAAQREQELARIEDPALQEQMREFYKEMDRIRASQQP